MKKKFFIRSIINSDKKHTSEKISKKIISILSTEDFEVKEFHPYWKDKAKYLFEVSFFKEAEDFNGLQSEMLRIMSNMSSTWTIILGDNFSLENSNFSAVSDSLTIQGVDWMNIENIV